MSPDTPTPVAMVDDAGQLSIEWCVGGNTVALTLARDGTVDAYLEDGHGHDWEATVKFQSRVRAWLAGSDLPPREIHE